MFAPRLTLNGPSLLPLFLPLLILFTQALTAAVAALLLPALPFLVRYINGSGAPERDGRPFVRPSQSE